MWGGFSWGVTFRRAIFWGAAFLGGNILGAIFHGEFFLVPCKRYYFLAKILFKNTTSFMMKSVEVTTTPSPIKNWNDACIGKNVNYVKSTIRQDEITIHPNSHFDNITDANITAINEETKLIALAKSPFSTTL